MKIFQIVTVSEHGGAQSVVFNLLEGMSADNDIFVLYGGNGEAWETLNKKVKRIKISEHRKGFSLKDIAVLFRLFYYRFKYNPDIVHLHSSKIGAFGRIAFDPKKIVYTVHGFDSLRKAYRKYLFIEKILKNRAAITLGVSKYDGEGLKEEGIIKDVKYIYNGIIDYTKEDIPEDPTVANAINDIKSTYSKLIFCIARISKQKKFDLFLDIAKALPQYAFVWIGNKKEIEGLPSNVFCLGEACSAHIYLRHADLYILPTNYEGLPISIIEALSYGIPVVASNVGGVGEMLDGKNGFAVDNTVDAFAERIEYSLKPDVYEQMQVDARKSYLDRFTIDKMINGYKLIYNQLYERRKK